MGIMPLRYRLAYTPRRTDMLWFGQVATKREMAEGGRTGPAGIMIIWENARLHWQLTQPRQRGKAGRRAEGRGRGRASAAPAECNAIKKKVMRRARNDPSQIAEGR